MWNETGPESGEPLPGGNGQIGMRERVAAFGGRLTTEATANRYRVFAVVPLADA